MSDTPLQMFGWLAQLCLGLAAFGGFYLGHSFFFDSSEKPWIGYAHHIASGRPEAWFKQYETRRDCMEAMAYAVSREPDSQWYSMPVGCGYVGQNRWLVRAVNMWSVGDDLHCISRVTYETEDGARYRPVLKRLADMPMRGPDWYCL